MCFCFCFFKENQLVLHVNSLYDKRINVVCKECLVSLVVLMTFGSDVCNTDLSQFFEMRFIRRVGHQKMDLLGVTVKLFLAGN